MPRHSRGRSTCNVCSTNIGCAGDIDTRLDSDATMTLGSLSMRVSTMTRPRLRSVVDQISGHTHSRGLRVDGHRSRVQSGSAVIQHIRMHEIGGDQRDAAIDAAEYEEIAGQRDHIFRGRTGLRTAIVGLDHQKVLAGRFDRGRGIETESGKCSGVIAEIVSVQPNICDGTDPIELEKVASRRG